MHFTPKHAEKIDINMPEIYEQLRAMAGKLLTHERAHHTLQRTALVHEAWLRLAETRHARWQSAGHFFGAAARAMRRVLVEHARKRNAKKRGGGLVRVDLDEVAGGTSGKAVDVIALDAMLRRLAAFHRRASRVVELRFFAGLTLQEAADTLGVSLSTVKHDWSFARAWLKRELSVV